MFKIFSFFDFKNLVFDFIALAFTLYMCIQELILYKKTKHLFHKAYSIFFASISMVFIPFVILILARIDFRSIQGILFVTVSVLFTLAALFFFFRAERLRKKSQ